MKVSDKQLQRMLNAAAKAPIEAPGPPPLGLETRVLAQWRAGAPEDDSASLFAFLRHAVVGASLVLALSALWSLSRPGGTIAGDEAALLNYEIQQTVNP